jgi:hypothetical protein
MTIFQSPATAITCSAVGGHPSISHPVTLTFESDDMSVMKESVCHGAGHLLFGKYTAPPGELQVGGKHQGLGLVVT